jgi:asparagine synthase (glutamine-hydrolysing)
VCGIAGAVGELTNRLDVVRTVVRQLLHRGPDEGGEFHDSHCSLAMRRLSIIDVAGGHQPISNETGSLVCVCNGELYNYRELTRELRDLDHVFATKSDVEVAVHGYETWGDDFVTRIHGMFALALWDARRQRLLLARDRVGKKPLYYLRLRTALVFASELRSLLTLPSVTWTVDRDACRSFCLHGYMPGNKTPITQIRRLEPGCLAIWDETGFRSRRYWAPEPAAPATTEVSGTENLLELLRESVRLRLISDVPVGAFLSGGLDSSVVVAIAAGELGARIPTFNVSFPGHKDHDESDHARLVAKHFGCEHHVIPFDPSHFDDLASTVWALDEPLADPAALPTLLLSREARSAVTVVLTGEGADEVFGGYERYALALRGSAIAARVPLLASAAAAGLRLRGKRSNDDSRWSRLLRAAAEGGENPLGWSRSAAVFPGIARASGWHLNHDVAHSTHPPSEQRPNRLLPVQVDDLTTMLANGLLTKVDRMTMAASVEARCPFLDHRIVSFGLGLPDSWKIRTRMSKVMLRAVAGRLLPREIQDRPKHTFRVPLAEWLRGTLKELALHAAASPVLSRLGIVNTNAVQELVADHVAGRADYSRALWALITLNLWLTEASNRFALEPAV